MPFADRIDAGRRLAPRVAEVLAGESESPPVVVLGLPRGGVPVAAEVARALGAPLDVVLVRKVGVPNQPELAMGAIGEGGVRVVNDEVARAVGIDGAGWERIEAHERTELARRVELYRGGRPGRDLRGAVAVLVDDGMATGSTMGAACAVVRRLGADRIVVAVPVAARSSVDDLSSRVDDVVVLEAPEVFRAVGEWYDDFTQTTDSEVIGLLSGE